MIPSVSQEWNQNESLEEYRRLCGIAAEFSRRFPKVTIAVAMCGDGSSFFGVAIIGDTKPRQFFEAEKDADREYLHRRFADAAGIDLTPETDETTGDEWDW